jgi:aspartyl-tRNA(Asn)/glutamyl-tRNA(Gln) amidotransferase subunit B
VAYLKALRAILVYLEICDGNMEEGSFRCDANVSLRPMGQKELGTRTELKNMNSFRNVERALNYEIERQRDILDDGEKVVQQTRLFDTAKGVTRSMRGKEEANDYRYFPDPDLVPLVFEDEQLQRWEAELPELPQAKKVRFMKEYGLPEYDADTLTADKGLAVYFEAAVSEYNQPKKIGNWMMTEMLKELNDAGQDIRDCAFEPVHLARLVKLMDEGLISGKIAKKVFGALFEQGGDPETYVREQGMIQISDTSAIEGYVDEVIAAHPDEVARFKGGEKKLTGFFVGQVMKKSRGKANPKLVNELLAKKIG